MPYLSSLAFTAIPLGANRDPALKRGSIERLGSVLETLIAATRAGELDTLLDTAAGSEERAIPRTKKAA